MSCSLATNPHSDFIGRWVFGGMGDKSPLNDLWTFNFGCKSLPFPNPKPHSPLHFFIQPRRNGNPFRPRDQFLHPDMGMQFRWMQKVCPCSSWGDMTKPIPSMKSLNSTLVSSPSSPLSDVQQHFSHFIRTKKKPKHG